MRSKGLAKQSQISAKAVIFLRAEHGPFAAIRVFSALVVEPQMAIMLMLVYEWPLAVNPGSSSGRRADFALVSSQHYFLRANSAAY